MVSMILRRYGSSYCSVDLHFESKALTEIGFRRDRLTQIPTEQFDAEYSSLVEHELSATAEGAVQDEVEQAVLDDLTARIDGLLGDLGDEDVLVIDSEQGVDYPKTRTTQKNIVVRGENRLHFTVRVDPPLRVSIRRKGSTA